MTDDERHLRRAIRLAMNGRGRVEPNPMVGCVIVKDGRVVGEGYHQQFGHPHAEPNALANCTESPTGATAYVTLEPCCHTNKKTPPCAPRLVRERIGRVVIGCLDPNPEVNGNGVRMLREAGVVVDAPLLEAECRQLIAPFFRRSLDRTPYLTMKWAESADGKVAGPAGRRLQISNARSSRAVQRLRGRSNGIVVGVNTILNDDPTLLPRDGIVPRLYDRMVLDTRLRTPVESQLIRTRRRRPITLFCGPSTGPPDERNALDLDHVRIVDGLALNAAGRLSLSAWVERLGGSPYTHLLIEPGPTLARDMAAVADRLWVIRSPNRVGDPTATSAAAVPDGYVPTGDVDLDGDRLTEYLNTRSPAFSAPVTSADLVLAASDLITDG